MESSKWGFDKIWRCKVDIHRTKHWNLANKPAIHANMWHLPIKPGTWKSTITSNRFFFPAINTSLEPPVGGFRSQVPPNHPFEWGCPSPFWSPRADTVAATAELGQVNAAYPPPSPPGLAGLCLPGPISAISGEEFGWKKGASGKKSGNTFT